MGKGILKFINFTKEAFFWPFHLVSFGIMTLVTVVAAIAGNYFMDLDPTGLFFVYGGLELIFLSLITKSRRFRRAITAKYGRELSSYSYIKQLAETYNKLSATGQRRFETLRLNVNEAKQNYSKLHQNFPDLVKEYVAKMDSLQINFIKLLASYEAYPKAMKANHPDDLRRQIQEIRTSMGDDSPKLRDIKEKRIKLLQQRIRNFHDSNENYNSFNEQLKTIEEMVKFFAEQPLASSNNDELKAIESLIEDTSDLHNTLGEIDDIMRSDLSMPTTTEPNVVGSGSQGLYVE